MSSPQISIFRGPTRVDNWKTVADPTGEMKKHLQTAVTLELYTIPLYLFAQYSVTDETTADAIKGQPTNGPLSFNSLTVNL